MDTPLQILLVEDSPDDAQLVMLQLEQDGLEAEFRWVDTEAAFRAALASPTDLILSDFAMPHFNGLQALKIVKELALDIPFILVSGTIGEEVAVEAMQHGADDYLMKDRLTRLGPAIQRALDQKQLREEKARADAALRDSEARFRSLIENSSEEVSILTADGSLLYESPSANPTLGYPRGEFLGKSLFQLVHSADLEHVQHQFEQLVQDPELHPRERFRLLHRNGTWRWVEAVGTNLLHEPAVHGIVVNYHDITERVQAEEQIRYQALLLENVSDAVVSTDMNGYIKSWNKAAEAMFGYKEEEIIGQSAIDIIKAEYISASEQEVSVQLQESGRWRGEVRVFRKDDTAVYSIASVSIIQDGNGNAIGFLSVNHDITERKHAEEKLRESEEQYRSLFEDSPVALWVEDFSGVKQLLDGLKSEGVENIPAYLREHPDFTLECANQIRVLDVNSTAVKLYHAKSKAELLGKLTDILRPLSAVQFEPELIYLAEGRLDFEREGIDQTLTGEKIYVNIRWTVAPGYETTLARVIVSTANVTERKLAEEKIQRQLQRLRALRAIDLAISSTFDMNLSLAVLLSGTVSQLGVKAAAILLYSPSLLTLEYAAGQGFKSSLIQNTRLRVGEGLAGQAALELRTMHTTNPLNNDSGFVRKELVKEEGFKSYYGVPLVAKGELKGVLEIFHDTELHPDQEWLDFLETLGGQAAIAIDNAQLFDGLQRSKLELEQRVAARTAELHRTNLELEHANRAKDEFLATMSHELRTPLNSILGLSESLMEQRRGPLNASQKKSLETVETSAQHLLTLINDILEVSKIEAGKLSIHIDTVSVKEVCESSLNFIKEAAFKKSIRMDFQPESSIIKLSADPQRLKQILINLLNNAVKFTPENGSIVLKVHTTPERDQVRFSVIDNGIGISPDDLKKLFTPFTQLDSGLSRQYGGTGLGLVLVYKMTELHGGSVEVESEVGKGSRFTVILPWDENTNAGKFANENLQPPVQVSSDSNTLSAGLNHILLADDNEPNILVVSDYLQDYGYRVTVAHNGLEALEKAEAVSPDIILMDIQMPEMDGLEAIRQLRQRPRFAPTPIIALTALAMPGDRERCLTAGANEYLSKPVSLKKLVQTINDMLGHIN